MTKLLILGLVILIVFFYVQSKLRRLFSVYDRIRNQQQASGKDVKETPAKEPSIDASQIEDAEFRDIR